MRDPTAQSVIQTFLRREAGDMKYTIDALTLMESPFKVPSAASEEAFAAVMTTSEKEQAEP